MIIFITGATDGLGRALAARLAADGHELILHGRDRDRLTATARSLGGRPHVVQADLAELAQVRRLAEEVRERTEQIDVLVSNAGIGAGERRISVDGHELCFAVNYLAGFLLTLELLPLLQGDAAPARIVNVASLGQQALNFDDLTLKLGYSGTRAYCQSKLAQVMSTFTLAERLNPSQVIINCLHPATYMPTKMLLEGGGTPIDSLDDGVAATRRLVSDPALNGVSGRFFNRTREARAHEQAYDARARATLWQRSLELTGVPDPFV